MPQADAYYVGGWLVEPSLNQISKKGIVKKLEPQLMQVLDLLASRPGWVITKEQLKGTIWADVIITENVITRAISSLRKLLGDDPNDPKYIVTISKTGYRLIAKVKNRKTRSSETFTIRLARKPVIVSVGLLILILLGAFAIRNALTTTVSKPAYHPLAIANHLNTEYWPAISPDGRFVAYGWKGTADKNWDIYAKLVGTETVLKLTDSRASELRAKWSADGNYIYYLRYEAGSSTIYKKPVTGGSEIRVLEAPKHSFGDFDVSPDGKWISFNDRPAKEEPLAIQLISLETGQVRFFDGPTSGFNGDIHPRFSPDGSKIAFIREKNSTSMYLYVIDLLDSMIEQVSFDPVSINGFDWSKNGDAIVYSSDRSGLYKLWELNLETNTSTVLQSGDYQMVMPRVAQTGRIVYSKMKDNVNIWSYHLENKTAEPWFATNELNLNASFSPDGSRACFTKQKDGRFEVWTSDVQGTNAIPITQFIGQYLTAPRWSSDGEYIFFQGHIDGQSDIFKVNAKGGVPENLTHSEHDEQTPFPTQDGNIFYSSNKNGKWEIWRMDDQGDNNQKIVEGPAYGPQLNPGGDKLYYSRKDTVGIWEFDLKERMGRLLIEAFHPRHWGALAVTEDEIYYLNPILKRFDVYEHSTGQSRLIYQPRARIPRLGITLHLSQNQKQLLFSQIDTHDADIMLLEEQIPQ